MKGRFETSSPFAQLCLLALIMLCSIFLTPFVAIIYCILVGSEVNQLDMRAMLIIQNTFLFLIAPLTAQHLFWKKPMIEVLHFKKPSATIMLLGLLTLLASTPFIDWLNTINQSFSLPNSLHGIEQWMIDSEKQTEVITKKLLEVGSLQKVLMNLFIVGLMAGVGEELLFRGVLQKIFIRMTHNIHWAIFITAFIFSAIHLQFFGFLPRLVLGMLLGYLYVWSKNLWVPIAAHTINNSLVVIFTLNEYNKGNVLIEKTNEIDNSPTLIILSILITCTCLFYLWKSQRSYVNI